MDRTSELKGLSSQDPMKSEQDQAIGDNEFRDLQMQLYDISQMKFNGVSLFANYRSDRNDEVDDSTPAIFSAENQVLDLDHSHSLYKL